MEKLKRLKYEIALIVVGLVVMASLGAIGQFEKLIFTATSVAIPTALGFIASKKLSAEIINWEAVSENTKAYFRLGVIVVFVLGYAIISNSFAVKIGF
jgi:hypothetical protein